jgi:hypothetical protein
MWFNGPGPSAESLMRVSSRELDILNMEFKNERDEESIDCKKANAKKKLEWYGNPRPKEGEHAERSTIVHIRRLVRHVGLDEDYLTKTTVECLFVKEKENKDVMEQSAEPPQKRQRTEDEKVLLLAERQYLFLQESAEVKRLISEKNKLEQEGEKISQKLHEAFEQNACVVVSYFQPVEYFEQVEGTELGQPSNTAKMEPAEIPEKKYVTIQVFVLLVLQETTGLVLNKERKIVDIYPAEYRYYRYNEIAREETSLEEQVHQHRIRQRTRKFIN